MWLLVWSPKDSWWNCFRRGRWRDFVLKLNPPPRSRFTSSLQRYEFLLELQGDTTKTCIVRYETDWLSAKGAVFHALYSTAVRFLCRFDVQRWAKIYLTCIWLLVMQVSQNAVQAFGGFSVQRYHTGRGRRKDGDVSTWCAPRSTSLRTKGSTW